MACIKRQICSIWWGDISVEGLERLDSVFYRFLKRVLGVPRTLSNRVVYLVTGCPGIVERAVRENRAPVSAASTELLRRLERKLGEVKPDVFRAKALVSEYWKAPRVQTRREGAL